MKALLKLYFLTLAIFGITASLQAQGTAFSYQGRLNLNGVPTTGLYDLRFTVYAGLLSPGPLGQVTIPAVPVTNGLFAVTLDFGSGVFTGPQRWLEIAVRTNGAAGFVALDPRQQVTATPYATYAGTASNVISGSVVTSLNNLRDNVTLAAGANVTLATNSNTLTISSTGPGGAVWSLSGANTYYNAGNVGIGTSAPGERLTIAGVSSYNNGLKLTGNTASGTGLTLENTSLGGHRYAFLSGGDFNGVGAGGFGIYDDTIGDYRFAIGAGGNVGIGTAFPARKLTVYSSTYGIEHTDGSVRLGTYLGNAAGWLGTVSNHKLHFFANDSNPRMTLDTAGNVGIGTITPQAKLDVVGTIRSSVLTITGGADIAEPFKMSSTEIPKGAVVVIDEQKPGHLKMSTTAYDTRVAGIVSGANGIQPGISLHQEGAIEGGLNVALSGRVYVQADAATGAIKAGDLLTTSDTPGYAMKVTDHGKAQGAILGKAMSSLNEGKGMVLVLVTLQ